MHHLMVELFSLDDVGQSYDIALTEENRVSVTLGRHTNDLMTSFYCKSPSAFMIECGWGGREIDPQKWQPFEMHNGPSLWGHERVWLPPADREVAREMRMRAAAAGLRAPVQVADGNYHLMSGTCPWWDGTSAAARADDTHPRCFLKNSVARPHASSAASRSCTDCRCSLTKACSAS